MRRRAQSSRISVYPPPSLSSHVSALPTVVTHQRAVFTALQNPPTQQPDVPFLPLNSYRGMRPADARSHSPCLPVAASFTAGPALSFVVERSALAHVSDPWLILLRGVEGRAQPPGLPRQVCLVFEAVGEAPAPARCCWPGNGQSALLVLADPCASYKRRAADRGCASMLCLSRTCPRCPVSCGRSSPHRRSIHAASNPS